jgi:hypothetical protein
MNFMRIRTIGFGLGALTLLTAGSATAQMRTYEGGNLLTRNGMEFSVGGGVQNFTTDEATDVTGTAGTWEARVIAGTRRLIAIEAAYIGSAQSVDAIGLDSDAVLLGTGLEGDVRVNWNNSTAWQPYALIGAGWKRYDVTNADFNTSAIADDDNLLEIPMGIGVAYRFAPLVLDVRGVFRPAVGNDLIAGDTSLHNWSATARAGFEF